MSQEVYITIIIFLIGVIVTMVGAWNVIVVWEARQVRADLAKLAENVTKEITALTTKVTDAALAAAQAATIAATLAARDKKDK